MNEMPPLAYIPRSALPRYFSEAWYDGVNYFGETELDCLDCRELKNSTHIKPGFWPE